VTDRELIALMAAVIWAGECSSSSIGIVEGGTEGCVKLAIDILQETDKQTDQPFKKKGDL
jgi:hypothetical protein